MLSVSLDANGYTIVTPSADSRLVYVSVSGNDSNDGLSPSTPVKTFAHAQTLIRSGFPDEMLLKRGDIFDDYITNWNKSGRSVNEPVLIGAYGTGPRPIIHSGANFGAFATLDSSTVNFLDVIGIAMIANNKDPNSPTFSEFGPGSDTGFQFGAKGGNVLVEDCFVQFYRDNFDIEGNNGPLANITLRRNVIVDSWSHDTNLFSEGVYSHNLDHFSVIGNIFDHNGWNTQIPSAVQTGHNHDMYFSYAVSNADVEGNIYADASFAGINLRPGGIVKNNLFVNDAIAVSYGNADGAMSTAGGVSGEISGNVVDGDKGVGTGLYGQGFAIGNITPGKGLLFQNNIIAHDTQNARAAILLTMATGTTTPGVAVGENDVTIQNNIIYGWYRAIEEDGRFQPGGTGLYAYNNVSFISNDIIGSVNRLVRKDGKYDPTQEHWSSNRYYDAALTQPNWFTILGNTVSATQWKTAVDPTGTILTAPPAYADPNRTTASYDATLGGPGTLVDFMAQARMISRDNYRPQYLAQAVINYIQAGFTIDTTPPQVTAVSLPAVGAAATPTGYTFTVTYGDDFFLDKTSLNSNDLLVTGPNGFSQIATFVSAAPSTLGLNGYQSTVATYKIVPPGGAWSSGASGAYTVSLRPNQVRDMAGHFITDGVVGSFQVDLLAPTAAADAPLVSSASIGATSYSFTVVYTDNTAINPATLDGTDIEVTGPGGFDQIAALTGTTGSGTAITATYTITPPGGAWTADDAGTYTITAKANSIFDTFGNPLAGAALATFAAMADLGGLNPPPPSGSISGTVFNDANGNGALDVQELGLVNVFVYIDTNLNGQWDAGEAYAVTDNNGRYTIGGLADGQYTLREIAPINYRVTNPSTGNNLTTLSGGAAILNADFADQIRAMTGGGPPLKPVLTPIGIITSITGLAISSDSGTASAETPTDGLLSAMPPVTTTLAAIKVTSASTKTIKPAKVTTVTPKTAKHEKSSH